MKNPKRPRDANQLAKNIVDLATEEFKNVPTIPSSQVMSIQDVARMGGLKGGKARAKSLTKAERVKIAKVGAKARWHKANLRKK